MKKHSSWFLLLLLLASCGEDPSQEYRNGGKTEDILTVEGWVIQHEILPQNIQAVGTVLPDEQVDVKSEIHGRVAHINFDEGETVRKGQLLVQVDDSEYAAQLKKAKSSLELADQTEERLKKLLSLNSISQEEYDQALTEKNKLTADVSYYASLVNKCRITAPFSGRIGLRKISPGEVISNGTSIANLVKNKPVKIEFNVPGEKAGEIRTGQKIYFEAETGTEGSAKIYAFDPLLDVETRSLKVRAIHPNQDEKLIPGNYVNLKIDLGTDSNAILVPTQAAETQIDGQIVYLIDNGKVKIQKVQGAGRTDRYLQVAGGLQPGDTVMMTGLLQAKPGIPVKADRIVKKSDLEAQQ